MIKKIHETSIKKVINNGPVKVFALIIIELLLLSVIIGLAILLALDGDSLSFQEKILAILAIPFILIWAVFIGFVLGSRIVLTEYGIRYFGVGRWLRIFDPYTYKSFLKYAEFVRYSDIQYVHEQCEDNIPYTKPQKFIVLNMKDGTIKRIPVNTYSKYRIEDIISQIVAMSGNRILTYKKVNEELL